MSRRFELVKDPNPKNDPPIQRRPYDMIKIDTSTLRTYVPKVPGTKGLGKAVKTATVQNRDPVLKASGPSTAGADARLQVAVQGELAEGDKITFVYPERGPDKGKTYSGKISEVRSDTLALGRKVRHHQFRLWHPWRCIRIRRQ